MQAARLLRSIILIVCILGSPFGCSRELPEAFKGCWDGPLPAGASRLPNGRVVLPAGKQISVIGFPQNLALSPDGRTLVVTLNGLGKVFNQSLLTMNTSSGSMHYMFFPTLFQGIAMSPDGSRVYASGGGDNAIYVLSVGAEKSTYLKNIPVAGYPVGLTVSPTGEILAACSLDDTVKVVDPSLMAVTVTIPVGKYPWAVAVDKEGEHIYVANRGDGTITSISANGDPIKTIGLREKDHPAALVISPDRSRIYVANANTDTLGIIAGGSELIQAFYSLGPFPISNPGSIPSAMVLSPDGRRLYVALSGENAVSVYSVPDIALLGKIPTGWYPSALALSPDGSKLYVANAKGKTLPELFPEMTGSISVIDVPEGTELANGSDRVSQNNCIGVFSNEKRSGMKHVRYVVVIQREGKTYDSLFGDLGPDRFGDPSGAVFTRDVTPNAHALAESYALAPFFFADGESPAQNRHWLYSAYASDFLERTWPSSYGGHNRIPDDLSIMAMSPAGTIFEECLLKGVPVRIYGGPLPEDPVLQSFTSAAYAAAYSNPARADVFVAELKNFVSSWNLPGLIYILLPSSCPDNSVPCTPSPSAIMEEDAATGKIIENLSRSPYWGDMAVFLVETSPPYDAKDSVERHRTACVLISPYANRGYTSTRHYSIPNLLSSIEAILDLSPMTQFDGNAMVMDDLFSEEYSPEPYKVATP